MSIRGNCWDNAAVELFSSSFKKECICKRIYNILDMNRVVSSITSKFSIT